MKESTKTIAVKFALWGIAFVAVAGYVNFKFGGFGDIPMWARAYWIMVYIGTVTAIEMLWYWFDMREIQQKKRELGTQ